MIDQKITAEGGRAFFILLVGTGPRLPYCCRIHVQLDAFEKVNFSQWSRRAQSRSNGHIGVNNDALSVTGGSEFVFRF